MNIQSISIVVPTKGCVNKCKFCVSRMHENPYEDCFESFQIEKRIKWAVMNGVNTCILTGTGEALQNYKFLSNLHRIFKKMDYPFPNVELQTSGVLLMEGAEEDFAGNGMYYPNISILKDLGVNTISVSVSDPFDDENNMRIIGVAPKLQFKLIDLCKFIREQGFNLRLSLNMTNAFDDIAPVNLFLHLTNFKPNQITFRKLWHGVDMRLEQTKWVAENSCKGETLNAINEYVAGKNYFKGNVRELELGEGKALYQLPFGATVYSLWGMSTVVDNNCMSKDETEKLKYVILRENGKLYCQWDDDGSLIF
jgi:hypothetical protein